MAARKKAKARKRKYVPVAIRRLNENRRAGMAGTLRQWADNIERGLPVKAVLIVQHGTLFVEGTPMPVMDRKELLQRACEIEHVVPRAQTITKEQQAAMDAGFALGNMMNARSLIDVSDAVRRTVKAELDERFQDIARAMRGEREDYD